MPRPQIIPENIVKKIKDLEAEREVWIARRATPGPEQRVAQTALIALEARLRWYRGRAEGKKPTSAHSKAGRRQTKARNRAALDAVHV